MDAADLNLHTRCWKWVARGFPILLMLSGLAITCIYGWSYLQQTVFLNHQKLPVYQPAEEAQLWIPEPQLGMKIGDLIIPSLDIKVPIVQGTDEQELKFGVGHYLASALPGQGGHVFLAGHRDTVFRKLKHLKIGDQVVFSSQYGNFIYEVTDFKVVSDSDTSVLRPTNFETLTLQTCYPFTYIGPAPDRYIVSTKYVGVHKDQSIREKST